MYCSFRGKALSLIPSAYISGSQLLVTPAPGCSDTSVLSGYLYSCAPIFNNVILLKIIKSAPVFSETPMHTQRI